MADEVTETFGVRVIEWSPKGLFVNGKSTLLRGGCIHHDNGILGAATYAKSEERRVRILKENGFNAIRSSHNPTSEAIIAAYDKYGVYLMDETFDMWYNRKNKFDYGCDFHDWWERDTAAIESWAWRGCDGNNAEVEVYARAEERYDTGSFTTYHGRALAVVRADKAGTLTVSKDKTSPWQTRIFVLLF